jgi:MFS family permease
VKVKNKWISYSTWSLAVLFLFYEFFVRVYPTVMVRNLMESFSVTAGSLGILSAFFFYAYAPMQIPVGLLMDRFGPRRLLSFASLLCGIGSFLFGMAEGLPAAKIGRFLMGIGSAFAFVGMVYVCSHMFPPKKRALLIGIGNSIGMLGAVGATGPLSYSVELFGWRLTVNAFGFIGLALAVILYFFIQKEEETHQTLTKQTSISFLKNLKVVCLNYRSWLNGIIALLTYMTTAAFASLWGVPFLMESYGFSKELAGFIVSMIFVGWIIGGPIIGVISDKFNKRKPFLFSCIVLTALALLPVLYISHLPIWLLFVLLLLVGFFQSGELLNFSLAIELNPMESKGTSIAFTNFLVACGTSMIQPLIGVFLDLGWDGLVQGGVPIYSVRNYHFAMLSFPIALLLAFILLFFLKERQKVDKEIFSEVIGMD